MKNILPKVAVIAALATVPSLASADYVCSVVSYPNSSGNAYRMRVIFTSQANCAGTTSTLWYCEKGVNLTSSTCALDGLRFDRAQLTELFAQTVRAADTQQIVSRHTTTCGNNVAGCGYSIDFSY